MYVLGVRFIYGNTLEIALHRFYPGYIRLQYFLYSHGSHFLGFLVGGGNVSSASIFLMFDIASISSLSSSSLISILYFSLLSL